MNTPRTLAAAAAAIAHRELTPLELVSDCLERIDLLESRLRAWVIVDRRRALQAAEGLTREAEAGRLRGPLHGIPLGIKDVVDVEGLPTRAGSAITSDQPADADAPIVAALRKAGAIVLGKTVTTEFACFDPPPTRNPWNLAHTPGGSSSGSAAALAVGMCLGAIGSQTGGSITRPASYCGVAGVKPTFGRVSRRGVVPVTFHLDHVGPLARTAADCAVLLDVMAGDDPSDPGASPHAAESLALAELKLSRPPRLGVMRPYFFERADEEVAKRTAEALTTLMAAGAQLVELPLLPGFDVVHAMHRRIMATEAFDYHCRAHHGARGPYGPKIAGLLEEGRGTSMADYQEALRHQVAFGATADRALAGVDALLVPATSTAAPGVETTGDPAFNSVWSHAGVPTVSIPCALTRAGLPLALQLVGPKWHERQILQAAIWCEERLGFDYLPEMIRR